MRRRLTFLAGVAVGAPIGHIFDRTNLYAFLTAVAAYAAFWALADAFDLVGGPK